MATLAALLLQGATAQEVITIPKKVFGTGPVRAAAYSPDGKIIVTGNAAGAYLWDARTGAQILRFPGPIEEVYTVAFSPDGSQVATGLESSGRWQGVRLWDVATGEEVWEAELADRVDGSKIAFSPDGTMILWQGAEYVGRACVWDAATGELLYNLSLPSGHEIRDAAFSPDSSKLVTANGEERTVGIWDAATGQALSTFWGFLGNVTSVAFSPDGTKILSCSKTSGGEDLPVRILDAATGELLQTLDHYDWAGEPAVVSLSFSPDGEKVLTGACYFSDLVVVRLWDLQSGELEMTWEYTSQLPEPGAAGLGALCMSSDGTKALVVVGFYQLNPGPQWTWREWTVELLDLVNGGTILTLPVEDSASWAILSPDDSSAVVSEHEDNPSEARLWDLAAGEQIAELGFQRSVHALDLSSECRTLATASDGGTVVIWNVDSGREVRRFDWPSHPLPTGIDLSPDGSRLLLTGYFNNYYLDNPAGNYAASIWNPATGELVHLLGGPHDGLLFGGFSPDGQHVLLGGWGDFFNIALVLELWDAETGTLTRSFPGLPSIHYYNLNDLDISPSGDRILCAGDPVFLLMWDAATGAPLSGLPVPPTQEAGATSACFSPDGTQILTVSVAPDPGSIDLWDITTGVQIRTFLHNWVTTGEQARFARFSPDGKRTVSWSYNDIRVWETASGEHCYTMYGRTPWPFANDSVAFSPDGRSLFAVANDAVAMWELVPTVQISITKEADGRIVLTWQEPPGGPLCALQQCSNLSSGDWTDVAVTTPGRYEVTEPNGTMLYRLREL